MFQYCTILQEGLQQVMVKADCGDVNVFTPMTYKEVLGPCQVGLQHQGETYEGPEGSHAETMVSCLQLLLDWLKHFSHIKKRGMPGMEKGNNDT